MKYRDKIRKLGSEIKAILKQEEEEKQLRLSEMAVNKAKNLVEHKAEILSRPARTWIQAGSKRAREVGKDAPHAPLSKRAKKEEIKKKMKKAETVSVVKRMEEWSEKCDDNLLNSVTVFEGLCNIYNS